MTAIDFMPKTIGAAFGMSDENGIWRTGRCAANGRFFVAVSIPHNSGIGLEELVIGSVIAFTSTWRLGAQSKPRGSSLPHHENLEVCSELPSPSLVLSFFHSCQSWPAFPGIYYVPVTDSACSRHASPGGGCGPTGRSQTGILQVIDVLLLSWARI